MLPLGAVTVFEENVLDKLPGFNRKAREFMDLSPGPKRQLHMPSAHGVAG
jgi:hypothetical protein